MYTKKRLLFEYRKRVVFELNCVYKQILNTYTKINCCLNIHKCNCVGCACVHKNSFLFGQKRIYNATLKAILCPKRVAEMRGARLLLYEKH